jgi:hypothetical protein
MREIPGSPPGEKKAMADKPPWLKSGEETPKKGMQHWLGTRINAAMHNLGACYPFDKSNLKLFSSEKSPSSLKFRNMSQGRQKSAHPDDFLHRNSPAADFGSVERTAQG